VRESQKVLKKKGYHGSLAFEGLWGQNGSGFSESKLWEAFDDGGRKGKENGAGSKKRTC